MSAKKETYIVTAPYGCGGGDAKKPETCWWAAEGDTIKLTAKQAAPFIAQGLIIKA